jgi:hypothetical protein
VIQLEVQGKTVTITTVFDKDKAWINDGQETKALEGDRLKAVKEIAHFQRLARLYPLLDDPKAYPLSPLGEVMVGGKPAVGVRVESKGYPDISFYFDKGTGLPVKVERRTADPVTGKEAGEERLISDYQDVDGAQFPKKVTVLIDGKKLLDAEVTAIKAVEKLDDSNFGKP